jgi:hypothetical protein
MRPSIYAFFNQSNISIYLLIYLPIYLSTCLSIYLSITYLPTYLLAVLFLSSFILLYFYASLSLFFFYTLCITVCSPEMSPHISNSSLVQSNVYEKLNSHFAISSPATVRQHNWHLYWHLLDTATVSLWGHHVILPSFLTSDQVHIVQSMPGKEHAVPIGWKAGWETKSASTPGTS